MIRNTQILLCFEAFFEYSYFINNVRFEVHVKLHMRFEKICMIRNTQILLCFEAFFEYSYFINNVRLEVHVKLD
jgi:hypothetical protein